MAKLKRRDFMKFALDVDLEQEAKQIKGIRRIMKKICWYHYNRYSNPLKILNGIMAIICVILGFLIVPACFVFAAIFYIGVLLDRGFGEPGCPY